MIGWNTLNLYVDVTTLPWATVSPHMASSHRIFGVILRICQSPLFCCCWLFTNCRSSMLCTSSVIIWTTSMTLGFYSSPWCHLWIGCRDLRPESSLAATLCSPASLLHEQLCLHGTLYPLEKKRMSDVPHKLERSCSVARINPWGSSDKGSILCVLTILPNLGTVGSFGDIVIIFDGKRIEILVGHKLIGWPTVVFGQHSLTPHSIESSDDHRNCKGTCSNCDEISAF